MHVATFLQDLAGGGAERVAVLLMNGLVARGERVTLILARREGPYLDDLDPAIELVDFQHSPACPLAAFGTAGYSRQPSHPC